LKFMMRAMRFLLAARLSTAAASGFGLRAVGAR
jgi:hypothetical protein